MKKTKLAAIVIAATAAMSGVSSAVSLSLLGFANTSVGLITLEGATGQSGRAIFIATTADINTSIFNNLNPLLVAGTTSAQLNTALATAIGTTSGTSPGIVRTFNFSGSAMSTTGSVELGAIGNNTYLVLVSETGGLVNGFGAYTGADVPSLGSVTFNPANAGDSIGIGTSVFAGPAGPAASGFQLAAVPEPSAALLGALGALGLLRRRRN
jgi:hypothetical protein